MPDFCSGLGALRIFSAEGSRAVTDRRRAAHALNKTETYQLPCCTGAERHRTYMRCNFGVRGKRRAAQTSRVELLLVGVQSSRLRGFEHLLRMTQRRPGQVQLVKSPGGGPGNALGSPGEAVKHCW